MQRKPLKHCGLLRGMPRVFCSLQGCAVGFLAVLVMTTVAAYDLCQVLGWKHGLHAKPAQAKEVPIAHCGLHDYRHGNELLRLQSREALVVAGVVQGFSTPPLLLLIMLMTNNRVITGDRVNSGWANVLGWTTPAAVFAARWNLFTSGSCNDRALKGMPILDGRPATAFSVSSIVFLYPADNITKTVPIA
jgi:hypothetical protein